MTFEKKMPTIGDINKNQDNQNNFEQSEEVNNKDEFDENSKIKNEEDAEENEQSLENNKYIEQIKELQQKNSELEKKLLYLAAEYKNSEKRSKMEIENANKFAISKFAIDAINIYDVLLTALQNVDAEKTDKILFEGVKMTVSEFDKMFERAQISKINPDVGSVFDHNKHEAISRVSSDINIGSIVKVIRPGYEINGRLLRPAYVIVSGGK